MLFSYPEGVFPKLFPTGRHPALAKYGGIWYIPPYSHGTASCRASVLCPERDGMEQMEKKRSAFAQGLRDGIPIALGYFAVAFSLGIAARDAGLYF